MGCGKQQTDSVEHYLCCPIIRRWMQTRLRLDGASFTRDKWMFAVSLTDGELQLTAVVLYVVYRTTQHLRHREPTTGEYRNHFLNQMLHEAVRDDPRLRRVALGIPAGRGVKRRAAGA